ncbi:MAG: hypothetical protein A2V79_06385 [Betaproteobacteria bacterium RBG_16_56_24]|nr:MAG: hypothetical protein A2V79_06385 [Betaproteobacteria bacterium RBG_16_56_24]
MSFALSVTGGASRANFARISHKKSTWPNVLAMCFTAYASQVWAVNESSSVGADKSADGNEPVAPSARMWRSLALSYGSTRHHYREPDPFARVDPLDSETGSIPTTQATLRWRGKLAQALPEIAVQAQASYAQGQTDYNGYLQSGITLTPYSARTGNTLRAYNLRVGLPLNAFTRQPRGQHNWAQHIAPYAEQSWHHWQRNLTQYGETFTWQTTSLGVMALWPLADLSLPQISRFTLEADLSTGRTHNPHMAAPALGFAVDLGSASTRNAVLALHYVVTPTWLLGLRYEAQRMSFGASPTVAGLQYPGSNQSSQSIAASMSYQY